MADYKMFKTLTIKGTTFGLQEGLGEHITDRKTITNFPTSWEWTSGASITFPKGNSYIVRFEANIPTATTSGSRMVGLCVSINGVQSWINRITSADASQVVLQGMGVVNAVNYDLTATVQVVSNKAVTGNTVSTLISGVRIIEIPST